MVSCLRCGGALGEADAPESDRRCDACEAEFRALAAKVEPPADRFVLWAALALVAAFALVWVLLTFTQLHEPLAILAGGGVFAAVAAIYMVALHPEDRRNRDLQALRRGFLAERRADESPRPEADQP